MMQKKSEQNTIFNMSKIKENIEKELGKNETIKQDVKILEQKIQNTTENLKKDKKMKTYVLTGVPGFDELFEKGIPKGSNVLIAGGAGSGKTIFCLQILEYHASRGEKCFYMSFEESEKRLMEHMEDFGWNPEKLIASGNLKIKRYLPSDIHYLSEKGSDNAMFAKEEDSQLLQLEPVTLEEDYKPDFVVIDSLTAIASSFLGKEGSYRFYAERLFRFFEKIGSTNYFTTETLQMPETFSQTGVEEFLADGVIVFYKNKQWSMRQRAIEVLKMRGSKHQEKIVAIKISDNGLIVYPKQEVFGEMETK
ncbi:MAG: AAA family ATPase [Candidatus Thermoplasmatota archaeon]|nr:AAA family ATPase [Candidatus Thermoplasmatota archaeon]